MLACLDDRSTRPTDRIRAKTVLKQHALLRELIDFRGRVDRLEPAVVSSNRMRRMVITKNENDIWTLFFSLNGQADRNQGTL